MGNSSQNDHTLGGGGRLKNDKSKQGGRGWSKLGVLEGTYFLSVPLFAWQRHIYYLSDIPTTHQIIRNDNEIDNFRDLAALYDKNKFTCLEQERLILYSKSDL